MTASNDKKKRKVSAWYWYVPVFVAGASLFYVLFSTFRPTNQIEETVAIESGRRTVVPSSTPVVRTRELPVQARDVEAVGDRIAETIVYLKKRQPAAALRALRQAQIATSHALAARATNVSGNKELLTTQSEIELAERAIQRSAIDDATRQLNTIERKLDAIAH